MVQERERRKKEIDYGKILPPLLKIRGMTRVAESGAVRRMAKRMREINVFKTTTFFSKANFQIIKKPA